MPDRNGVAAVVRSPLLVSVIGSFTVFVACFVAIGMWSVWSFGDLRSGLAYISGESLVLDPGEIDLGTVVQGQVIAARFNVRNLSAKTIQILGAEPDCSCVTVKGVPATLLPAGRREIVLNWRVNRPRSGDIAAASAVVLLGSDHPRLVLRARGRYE